MLRYGFRPLFRCNTADAPAGGNPPDGGNGGGNGDPTAKRFSQADINALTGSVRAEERGKWAEKLEQSNTTIAEYKKQIEDRDTRLKEHETKLSEFGKLVDDGKAALAEVSRLKTNQTLMAKGAHPDKVDDLRLLLENSGALAPKDGKDPNLDEVLKSARERYGTAFFTDPATTRTPDTRNSGKNTPGAGAEANKPLWQRARG